MNLSVVLDGTATRLDDDALGVRLIGYDGWGMAPLHRLAQRGAQQHGETDLGFYLDPRFGTLMFRFMSADIDEFHTYRDGIIRLFAPGNDPVLRFTLSDGSQRDFDCHFAGGLNFPWDHGPDWTRTTFALRLKAPDPTCYDPTAQEVLFALGGASSGFEVPTPVPSPIGTSVLAHTETIAYAGSARSFPHRIRIIGPIDNARIENKTTDEVLDFDGVSIAAGDYYDIDCRYAQKTVQDSSGTNKIADLTDDSDLATWHLAAPVDGSSSRDNEIYVTGASVTGATEVQLLYYRRYLGV